MMLVTRRRHTALEARILRALMAIHEQDKGGNAYSPRALIPSPVTPWHVAQLFSWTVLPRTMSAVSAGFATICLLCLQSAIMALAGGCRTHGNRGGLSDDGASKE
jgi:hypothetical protein